MGLKLFSSCSIDNWGPSNPPESKKKNLTRKTGNPDPKNFEISKLEKISRFVVVMIKYPDSTNYEGNKILVFENISPNTILKLESIDPHFCDSTTHSSPIARFTPTQQGWGYAVLFCKMA